MNSENRKPSWGRLVLIAFVVSAVANVMLRLLLPVPPELISVITGLLAGVVLGVILWRSTPSA